MALAFWLSRSRDEAECTVSLPALSVSWLIFQREDSYTNFAHLDHILKLLQICAQCCIFQKYLFLEMMLLQEWIFSGQKSMTGCKVEFTAGNFIVWSANVKKQNPCGLQTVLGTRSPFLQPPKLLAMQRERATVSHAGNAVEVVIQNLCTIFPRVCNAMFLFKRWRIFL